MRAPQFDIQYVTLHGHRRAFVKVGSGPVILLLHGLACDHTTWSPVIAELAKRYTVIAPDLLGHGQSAKPRADYTLGGYANGMRDLLTVLDIDRATVVGHSFGGGVAMQFSYQFPERTERLMLVSAGGLGAEVTPLIKAIQGFGWEPAMRLITRPGIRHAVTGVMRASTGLWPKHTRDLDEVADIVDSWADRRTRFAIRHLVRAVIDWRGQIVTMSDRAYLTEALPLAVLWGEDDQVLPARHLEIARTLAPGAITELFEDAGHFPHKDHPEEFVAFVDRFMTETEPSDYSRETVAELLRRGSLVDIPTAEGGDAPVDPVPAALVR
ncbi:alpha/beta fold hydrolase [Nocardioides cavernaquae]|uniref:Alpha/beta fold hydrolase n=1 Tax=Nocardioides cavernaquae TaxID=2321396 RepID=A0A3A5HDJ6_9ACTN|nr:alpha/beta fold hydrolase [Nocardioides cavernaquae]RJS47585.1 alpha/beta fold hydrolase [Nocardioides cavernaquae]